jgi:hypothetical protein
MIVKIDGIGLTESAASPSPSRTGGSRRAGRRRLLRPGRNSVKKEKTNKKSLWNLHAVSLQLHVVLGA